MIKDDERIKMKEEYRKSDAVLDLFPILFRKYRDRVMWDEFYNHFIVCLGRYIVSIGDYDGLYISFSQDYEEICSVDLKEFDEEKIIRAIDILIDESKHEPVNINKCLDVLK